MENRNQKMQGKLSKMRSVKEYFYDDTESFLQWKTLAGMYVADGKYENIEPEWSDISVGQSWQAERDHVRWFSHRVNIPDRFAGRKVYLDLDLGGEGLLYINGEIVSAVVSYTNPSHKEMRTKYLLAECAAGGEKYDVTVETGLHYGDSGADARPLLTLRHAFTGAVNTEAEAFYYDITSLFEGMQAVGGNVFGAYRPCLEMVPNEIYNMVLDFNKNDALFEKLYAVFTASLNALDTGLGRERFLESLVKAREVYKNGMSAIPFAPQVTIHAVGNSHLDTAWLWPCKESVRKCARTFSNALMLMDQYPEFVFAQSQIQLYEYTKKYYPTLFERIRERVKEGRWEIVGNGWVESDANIPSGEALIRQLLYGRNFCLKEFDKASNIFWMPDVFGYSWALPQILKRSGIEYFYTCKLNSNEISRFPHTLFNWQGVDGTKILTYVQKISYASDMTPFFMHYAWWDFDEKNVCSDIMFAYGFGDGGGGPTQDMQEFARRYENFPGLSSVKQGTALEYFETVAKYTPELPAWVDEMYYENHRGCYTSQAKTKKNNRKSELLFRAAEMASSFANKFAGFNYPLDEINECWKLILLNQFHDILPGSSITEVYDVANREYEKVLAAGDRVLDGALASLIPNIKTDGESVIVFNFLSHERRDVVTASLPFAAKGSAIAGLNGEFVPSHITGENEITFEATIPTMGYAVYKIVKSKTKFESGLTASETNIENRFYIIELDQGNITRIVDKRLGRDILAPGRTKKDGRVFANDLIVFEDKPESCDAWNIDMEYTHVSWDLKTVESVELIESSPVRAVLRTVRRYHQSHITQDLTIYNDIDRIDFITQVDWHEEHRMLKAAFSVDVLSPFATYEIAFGSIKRPTHWNTSLDMAKYEVSAHKWADLSEGGAGVAILNDCKYGYDIKDNVMRITLLRSPTSPDPHCDKGHHSFTYSLVPHQGDWVQAHIAHKGYELNVPLTAYYSAGTGNGVLPQAMSFASCSAENVFIDTVKLAEDGEGLILRVYEAYGVRCPSVSITLAFPVTSVTECNLMEDNEADIPCNDGFSFVIKPYEIKTFRIK